MKRRFTSWNLGGRVLEFTGADLPEFGCFGDRRMLRSYRALQSILIGDGVRAWNVWRCEHPQSVIDLSYASFDGAVLAWADLQGANLQGVRLVGANLRGACLNSANLSRANLCGASLVRKSMGSLLAVGVISAPENAEFTGALRLCLRQAGYYCQCVEKDSPFIPAPLPNASRAPRGEFEKREAW